MSFDRQRLLDLLPAIYRLRDGDGDSVGPLESLLAFIAEQVAVVEDSVDGLYADQFIETCAEWVVPYLGDLIGVRALHEVAPSVLGARAEVANTIGYRRRKGTAAMLERLARDTTGWPAHVVEYFELVGTTQYLQHIRPGRGGTANLRRAGPPGAFDPVAHTFEARSVERSGRYNIPNVGIFLWRLAAYPLDRVTARRVQHGFTVHPLGVDAPLFNMPRAESDRAMFSAPIHVPEPLRRRPLYDEVEQLRQAATQGVAPPPAAYFAEPAVFGIHLDGNPEPVPANEIAICDLSGPAWRRPPMLRRYVRRATTAAEADSASGTYQRIRVAVDPVLGRLAFPEGTVPARVEVSSAYGFAADIGGGPYDRSASIPPEFAGVDWQRGVGRDGPRPWVVPDLDEAIRAWNETPTGTSGVIAILDNGTYTANEVITVPAGSRLLVVAAGWPDPGPDTLGRFTPSDRRPHLASRLTVQGGGFLVLNGLLVEGGISVRAGALQRLAVAHCTIAPTGGGLIVKQANEGLMVELAATICGPVELHRTVTGLRIRDSIVASPFADPAAAAIDASGSPVDIAESTVLGTCRTRTIDASNSVFAGVVTAELRQTGCVRFSYLPAASRVPRRYRCVADDPDTTVVFTSTRFGDPAYCQLAHRCAAAIRMGADDGAEMGVYHNLFQPQRLANLRTRLDEYLRFGLAAGIHFAS